MKYMYPGCFDPITNGHIDIIRRASKLADELVVLVMDNRDKKAAFSLDDRVKMVKLATKDINNVAVDVYEGLTTDYIAANDIDVIIRGVRNTIDYEYEAGLASIFKTQGVEIESVFLPSNPKYTYLSSTVVRQHAMLGGDLSEFVPAELIPIIESNY